MISFNVTTTAQKITGSGPGLLAQHVIYNDSDEIVYVAPDGDEAVTTSTGIPINPGERWFHEPTLFGPSGPPALYVIHGGTGNKAIRYGHL